MRKLALVERIHIDKSTFERKVRRMVRLPDVEQAILIVRRRGGQQISARLDENTKFGSDLAMLEIAKADCTFKLFDRWREDE